MKYTHAALIRDKAIQLTDKVQEYNQNPHLRRKETIEDEIDMLVDRMKELLSIRFNEFNEFMPYKPYKK